MRRAYADRVEAGRALASALAPLAGDPEVRVVALPRGGVPVGLEVARALRAPLDVCVVRKLGVPWHPELAMGAIGAGGIRVLHEDLIQRLGLEDQDVARVAARESAEVDRREAAYRPGGAPLDVAGRTVILVDDGVATGATLMAALRVLRQARPARLVVAVPVGPADTLADLRALADEVVCPWTPEPFAAIGQWYEDFSQTSDEEVRAALEEARAWGSRSRA